MTGGDSKREQTANSVPIAVERTVWVFGYGSLVWKPNFKYQRQLVGYVKGYARRFWQGSTDHRGVPGAPGRVATLVQSEKEETWGMAYKVNPSDVQEVMAYLDHREKGGYTTREVTFYPQDRHEGSFPTLVYMATESNPNYLGSAPLAAIAEQVVRSTGPSGDNTEYVLELARALHSLVPWVEDSHLYSLERIVLELLT